MRSQVSRVWRSFSSATTAFFSASILLPVRALQLLVQAFRLRLGFGQSRLADLDLRFQFRRSPLQLAKVTPQSQRPGTRAFAAGNHAMMVVRTLRRQEVAIRVSARQAFGGGIIFHHVGIGEGRKNQIAIQTQLGFEAHQFPDRRHDPGLGANGRVAVAVRRARWKANG